MRMTNRWKRPNTTTIANTGSSSVGLTFGDRAYRVVRSADQVRHLGSCADQLPPIRHIGRLLVLLCCRSAHQFRRVLTDADITHRQHAIIESVFADVIDGPLAHLPSGSFSATAKALP